MSLSWQRCAPWSKMQNIQQDQQNVWEKRRYSNLVRNSARILCVNEADAAMMTSTVLSTTVRIHRRLRVLSPACPPHAPIEAYGRTRSAAIHTEKKNDSQGDTPKTVGLSNQDEKERHVTRAAIQVSVMDPWKRTTSCRSSPSTNVMQSPELQARP